MPSAGNARIVLRSRGGGNGMHNLAVSCRRCDTRKGDLPPTELLTWATAIVDIQRRKLAARRAAG